MVGRQTFTVFSGMRQPFRRRSWTRAGVGCWSAIGLIHLSYGLRAFSNAALQNPLPEWLAKILGFVREAAP